MGRPKTLINLEELYSFCGYGTVGILLTGLGKTSYKIDRALFFASTIISVGVGANTPLGG
jgi:hypothetical protein